ncbi:hypothetical protein GCM10027592_10410 [Spirosoma flavus]
MQTTIQTLIDQYSSASNAADQKSIKNQIHLQYYHASSAERESIRDIMQPFLDEIEQEMIEKDPIARQTYEMLKRFEASRAVAGHQ